MLLIVAQTLPWQRPSEKPQPLKVNFMVPGAKLATAEVVATNSIPLGSYLYLQRGTRQEKVEHLTQLRGQVKLRSKVDCLRFVRLETDSYLGYSFRRCWREISHNDTIWQEGWLCTIREKRWRSAGLRDPVVKAASGGWDVRRAIVNFDKDPEGIPSWLSEHVATDGGCRLISIRPLKTTSLKSVWWLTAVTGE